MRVLIATAVLLLAMTPAQAQGQSKGKSKGKPACESVKSYQACIDRADCTWAVTDGKCRKLKATPR